MTEEKLNYDGLRMDEVGAFEIAKPFIGVQIKRGPIVNSIGVEVSTVDVTLMYNEDSLVPQFDGSNIPVAPFVMAGGLDGALLTITRKFCAAGNGVPEGSVILFKGRVAEISEITGTQAQIQALSTLELLNVKMPRNVYQAQCVWTVYDAGCKIVPTDFDEVGVILSGSNETHIVHNIAGLTNGEMDQGVFALEKGTYLTEGPERTILSQTTNLIVLSYPLPQANIGANFTIWPTCNRSLAACQAFGNTEHIRFFPYIPTPETSY